jgi:hypothetical protein
MLSNAAGDVWDQAEMMNNFLRNPSLNLKRFGDFKFILLEESNVSVEFMKKTVTLAAEALTKHFRNQNVPLSSPPDWIRHCYSFAKVVACSMSNDVDEPETVSQPL